MKDSVFLNYIYKARKVELIFKYDVQEKKQQTSSEKRSAVVRLKVYF